MTGPAVVLDPESLLAHREFVRAIARSLLYDEHAAEDVVQETWLAAITAPRAVSRGWLATVARNLAVTRIRGDVRRREREAAAARPEGVPSNAEVLAREQARRSVVEEVLALPEPYRTTVLLRHLEELSPREVARRMQVPVETVRTRTRRAIDLLRVRLDARNEDDRPGFCLALVAWGGGMSKGTGTAAAAGGALLMGTKLTVVAAAVLLGLATWLRWPHENSRGVRTVNAPSSAPRPETATAERPRARAGAAPADAAAPAPPPAVAADVAPARAPAIAVPEGEIVGKALLGKERAPIEGVVVRVMGGSGSPGVATTVPKLEKQTTGPDGAFRFRDVAPGHYLFMADAPGHGARKFEAEIRPGGGVAVDVLFGVGGTIVGRVTTADGPAAGVTVGLEESPLTCRTDANGDYRLDDVAGGRSDLYHVRVGAAGADGRAACVVVPPGETRRVDFLADALLTGVVTLDGAPLGGATVWVDVATGRPERRSFKTRAGDDGSYRVSVAAGEAHVMVMAPLRFSVPVQDLTVHAGENRLDIGLGEGDFTERITGRVFVEATGESVNDCAFHVSLYPADRVPRTPDGRYAVGAGGFRDAQGKFVFGADATLDAKGRFDCPGLRRGLWRLVVHVYQGQPGHPDLRGADFDVNLLPGLPHEFEIGLGEELKDGSVSWLSGTVCDAKGSPLPGAEVEARMQKTGESRKGRADRSGRYTIRQLAPATWRLSVLVKSEGSSSAADVADATIVAGANTLDLCFGGDSFGEVSGRVLAKASGRPLAAGEVQLCIVGAIDGRFVAAALPGADGQFSFRSLRSGRLRLVAIPTTGSLREKTLDVDVAAGATVTNLEVALESMATGKVVFHVRSVDGRPFDQNTAVQFMVVSPPGQPMPPGGSWGGTSPTGAFEWNYEVGKHVVRAFTVKAGPDGTVKVDHEAQVTLDVREGETADVDVVMQPKK